MNWKEFETWQRWDEFPERIDNPPMTVDFSFEYGGKKYFVAGINQEYQILDSNWNTIVSNTNFKELLLAPIWEGKSFKDVIEYIKFEI